MLLWLADLSAYFSPLNVFRYITFRAGGATATALLFIFWFGPRIISLMRIKQGRGQPIRDDGPQSHLLTKRGTPTMGGLMILAGFTVATLLWGNLANAYVWIVLAVTLAFGAVGFYDDFLKVTKQSHKGFSGKARLAIEGVIAIAACGAISAVAPPHLSNTLAFPFTQYVLYLGAFFLIVGACVIVGAGNAVNLTDGLDGLAIVPVMIAAGTFGFIAYIVGTPNFAKELQLNSVLGAAELAVVCGAMIGAGLGFLWFNAPPAQIFMGDTGSLALGGMLGTVAVATKHEIVLGVVGGLFVLEAMSVIIQVTSFKLTGKRVFKMAPIHHHFEQLGWTEPQVVIRFWIIAVVLALIGLSTLKLR